MYRPGFYEWIIILFVVIIIFGPRNIPKLGKLFGDMLKGIKKHNDDKENKEE